MSQSNKFNCLNFFGNASQCSKKYCEVIRLVLKQNHEKT